MAILNFIKKNKMHILFLIVALSVSIFVYRGWFVPSDIIRGDWRGRDTVWLSDWVDRPYGWQSAELGGSPSNYNGISIRYPIWFVQGLLSKLGLGWDLSAKFIWFWPFIFFAVIGQYFLIFKLFRRKEIAFLSSLIFTISIPVFIRTSDGHIGLGAAYSLLPSVSYFLILAFEKNNKRYSMISAGLFSLLLFYDLRMAIIATILIGTYIIFNILRYKKHTTIIAIWFIVAGICFNLFWLIPLMTNTIQIQSSNLVPGSLYSFSRTNLFYNLIATIQYELPKNLLEHKDVIFSLISSTMLLLLGIVGLFFIKEMKADVKFKNSPFIFSILFSWIVFLFLSKGTNKPLAILNLWIFESIPLMSAFRNPHKFTLLFPFFLSIMIGLFLYTIIKKTSKIKYRAILLFILFLSLALTYPHYLGSQSKYEYKGQSTLQPKPNYHLQYEQFKKFNHNNQEFYNLYIPTFANYLVASNKNPAFYSDRSSNQYQRVMDYYLYLRHSLPAEAITGDLFKVLGKYSMKYIHILPNNDTAWHWTGSGIRITNYENLLKKQKGSKQVSDKTFENIYSRNILYFSKSNCLIVGGLDYMHYIGYSNLANCTPFYLADITYDDLKNLNPIIFKDSKTDLFLKFVNKKYIIEPWDFAKNAKSRVGSFVIPTRSENAWIRDSRSYWELFKGIIPYSKGIVSTRYPGSIINMEFNSEKGIHEIFIRTRKGSLLEYGGKPGLFSIQIDQTKISNISSKNKNKPFEFFSWDNPGEINLEKGKHNIKLTNIEGWSAVDQIIIIPKKELDKTIKKISNLLNKKQIVYLKKTKFYKPLNLSFKKYSWHNDSSKIEILNKTLIINKSNNLGGTRLNPTELIPINFSRAVFFEGKFNTSNDDAGFAIKISFFNNESQISKDMITYSGSLNVGYTFIVPINATRLKYYFYFYNKSIYKISDIKLYVDNIIYASKNVSKKTQVNKSNFYDGKNMFSNFNISNYKTNIINLNSQYINPAKINIKNKNLSDGYIIFTQSYNPMWKFNNITPIKALNAVNAFYINDTTESQGTIYYYSDINTLISFYLWIIFSAIIIIWSIKLK